MSKRHSPTQITEGERARTITFSITARQAEELKRLREITKVPQAVYVREGLDYVLRREAKKAARVADCADCGQPMLPVGAIKKRGEYDHARGCSVGA